MFNDLLSISILKSVAILGMIAFSSFLGIFVSLMFYIIFSGFEMIFIQAKSRRGNIILPFWVGILPKDKQKKIVNYIK